MGGGTRLGGIGSDGSSTAGVPTIIQSSEARETGVGGIVSFNFFPAALDTVPIPVPIAALVVFVVVVVVVCVVELVDAPGELESGLSPSLWILYSSLGGMICCPIPCVGAGLGCLLGPL